jgi:glucan phosphoethanolaminetransferase (alkaline phosphatase superfamily)
MLKIFKNELIENKKYLLFVGFISGYIFIADLLVLLSLLHILSVVISIILLIFISKISKTVFICLSLIILIINTILLHVGIHWGSGGVMARIEVAMQSPSHEITEYISTYLTVIDTAVVLYLFVGIYFIIIFSLKHSHSYRLIKIFAMIFIIVILIILSIVNRVDQIIPYSYIKSYQDALDRVGKVTARKEYLDSIKNEIKSQSNLMKYDYNKIIVVIGESANKNHMSLYNKDKNTTPFMSSLIGSYSFNVIAPTNQTRLSIPIQLTDATVDNFDLFYRSKSIVSIMNSFKFKTFWLSNQAKAGKNDTDISSIANESDVVKIANFDYKGKIDDYKVVEYLDDIQLSENKAFFIFHLYGSHSNYNDRYLAKTALYKKPNSIIQQYDNTIYYTDRILEKIYTKFKQYNTLFIYFSDHSEVIGFNKNGHGFLPGYKDEFDIPLFIYSNIENDRLLQLYNNNKKNIYNMEGFINIFKYIIGIEDNILKISTNNKVISVDKYNIVDINTLEKYRE